MYGTLDEAPDWQTMVANTVFNESRMDPDWLIHQRPGMSCQSHKDILRIFFLYNLVSVIVSVIFATPYFYEKIGLANITRREPSRDFGGLHAGVKGTIYPKLYTKTT